MCRVRPLVLVSTLLMSTANASAWAKSAYDPYNIGPGDDFSRSGKADANASAMQTMNEAQQALKQAQDQAAKADVLSKGAGIDPKLPKDAAEVAALAQQVKSLYDSFEAYQAVAKTDQSMTPQLDKAAGPGLPTHCASMDAEAEAADDQAKKNWIMGKGLPPKSSPDAGQCTACYTAAETKIDSTRIAFERLRIKLDYTTRLVKYGENALSGMGAAGGSLATMEAQAQIHHVDEAMADFYVAYDAKYTELLAGLKSKLDDFETCETKYFGNPDWYNRYGFIYYQFMADKYKR